MSLRFESPKTLTATDMFIWWAKNKIRSKRHLKIKDANTHSKTTTLISKNGDELDWIDKKVGFIVKYDKDQLCNAMSYLLTTDKLMIRFRKEARRVIQDQFNWDKIVLNLEKTYANLSE